jgi:hypothetical protein
MNILIFVFLISINIFTCKSLSNNFLSFADDSEIATITTDNEQELLEAVELLNKNGGTIYIDTPVINMVKETSFTLSGQLSGGIIGIRQTNGEYPRINFVHTNRRRQSLFGGISLYGANKFIEYIIIENSLSYGISVVGSNNILDHVISRYNHGSGFIVYGDFNTFNYCYSYRNCDANAFSINGDGFQIAGESNNVFNYCFAWDNSNSGFNYVRIFNSSDLSYLHSGSWNNGNIDVFTGKFDYDAGRPLDKNLWTIQDLIESDENFVSNYYNKKYNIDDAMIDKRLAPEWVNSVSRLMDGNGFTFGNRNSSQSIDVKRISLYNVAFDHKSGGFVDNYNHRYNAFVTDCVSFNNGINYRLPFTLSKWSNNWSWNSKNKEQLNGNASLKKPRNTNNAQRQFYSIGEQIIKAVSANMFPDGINFDRVIGLLL